MKMTWHTVLALTVAAGLSTMAWAGDLNLLASPNAAPTAATTDLATLVPPTTFAEGSWVTPAYISGTLLDGDHLIEAHAGVGYYFVNDLSINLEGVVSFADYNNYSPNPPNAWGGGMDLLFRWHFLKGENWSIYADGGAGIREYNRAFPTGGTHFNFTPQIGLGMTYKLDDSIDFMGGARLFHVSNAGIDGQEHNPAYDSLQVYLGVLIHW